MADSQAIGTIPIINNAIKVSLYIYIYLIFKGITTKPKLQQSSKHTTSRLLLLYNLVKKYKIKNDKVPYNPVMDFAIKNLENPAENVRSAAIYIISEAYRNLGETVRL
jgi:centrosomal protein CEP104